MEEKKIYTNRFPERITKISLWRKILIFALPLIFIIAIISEGYFREYLMLIILYVFLMPKFKIKSIINTRELCREVIKENKEISGKDKILGNSLLVEDGFIPKSKHKIMLVYVLLLPLLLLYIIFGLTDTERFIEFMIYSIELSFFLVLLAIYDSRSIFKYFKAILNKNRKKIFYAENLQSLSEIPAIPSWNYYQKKWSMTIIVVLIITIFLLASVFSEKIADEMLIIIPIVFITLLILITYDIRNIVIISLKILRRYDEYMKSKLGFVYEHDLRKKQNIFIEQFKADLKSSYNKMNDILNKNINDIFK